MHRGLNLADFFAAADRVLANTVPFDSSCWLSLDPATLLPTSHSTDQIGAEHLMDLAANEFLEDDVNKFADLARATPPVGTMRGATGGDLPRSPRHTRLLAPQGYGDGDELRAVFLDGGSAWGCVALHRRQGRFDDREVAFVAEVGGYIAAGIRRAILTTAMGVGDGSNPPGLVVLRRDDSIEFLTPAAMLWMSEIVDSTGNSEVVPLCVASVGHRARLAVAGQRQEVARARVPRRSGGWLLLDASLMDEDPQGRVGIILQAASTPEIAALIAEAHGLSKREREVTRLVLYGLSTREIGDQLYLSPYTVQDHLKAVFERVGVRSRRELVAQLFLQHYAPRLEGKARIGANGWFANETVAVSDNGYTRSD